MSEDIEERKKTIWQKIEEGNLAGKVGSAAGKVSLDVDGGTHRLIKDGVTAVAESDIDVKTINPNILADAVVTQIELLARTNGGITSLGEESYNR